MIEVTLYKVEFGDTTHWGDNTPEEFAKGQQKFADVNLVLTTHDPDYRHKSYIDLEQTMIFDRARMAEFAIAGLMIVGVEKMVTSVDISEHLSQIATKQVTFTQPAAEWNNRCDVHIAGHALSTYNEVMLLEDSCTDILQEKMNMGWRILAVCPQPDQRRPDHILGRWNPETATNDYADRG